MTVKRRSAFLTAVARAADRLRRARVVERARQEEFNNAVVTAVAAGFTVREVGAAGGVTGARVSRITNERKEQR